METEREGEQRNYIESLEVEISALRQQLEEKTTLKEATKKEWKGRRAAFPRHKWMVKVDADKAKELLAELFALRKKYPRYVGIQHLGTEAFLYYLPRKKTVQDYIDELRTEIRELRTKLKDEREESWGLRERIHTAEVKIDNLIKSINI